MASADTSIDIYSSNGTRYTLGASFNQNSTNIASNSSNVGVEASLTSYGGHWNSDYNSYLRVYWHDNRENYDRLVAELPLTTMPSNATVTAEGTIDVTHNSNGTLSGYAYATFTKGGTSSYCPEDSGVSNDWTALASIPRQTSITSFSVSKRNETSVKYNFTVSDPCDYAWYSKDNGATWYDLPANNIVTGLSPNTTYNFKLRVRRTDSQLTTTSTTVSQTTYKAPSQSLKSKTETSITMNWSIDSTANYIWYSKDNGANWTAVGSVNATSGSYTITGLSPNTAYNIKTRVRRSATSTSYDTTASSQTTYNYPYVSAVNTSALTIGNSQKLTLYNPLSRSVTVKMYKDSTSGTELYSGTTNGTSLTFTPNANTLYASIPNSQSGNCVYTVIYGSSTKTATGYTYKVTGTETPTFNDFTYKDSNTAVTNVTGNDQIMVKGLSTVEVTISSSNKMVANNSATAKNYGITMSSLNANVNYSSSDIVQSLGVINASGTQRLTVTAYDSRNLSKTVYKDITVYDYTKPVINASLKRLNDFESETTLKVNGTYTKLTIDNVNKNSVTNVKYRYRETGGSWGSWSNINTTVTNGQYTCNDVVLSLDNSKAFEFEIQVTDNLNNNTTNASVDVGNPIFMISSNNKKCYINNEEILSHQGIIDLIYPVGSIYLSVSPTNPSAIFGGTWARLESGFLYGSTITSGEAGGSGNGTGTSTGASTGNTGASSGNTGKASGNTGSTTLTVNQIPSHTHKYNKDGNAVWQQITGYGNIPAVSSTGANRCNIGGTTTQATGGGQGHTHTLNEHVHSLNSHTHSLNSHTHTIPYITVCVWKRTA